MRLRAAASALLIVLGAGCAPALFVKSHPDARLYPEPARAAVTFWGRLRLPGRGRLRHRHGPGLRSPLLSPARPQDPGTPSRSVRPDPSHPDPHAHQDHLQPGTLTRFSDESVILCPAPSAKHARGLGPRVRVMRPGDEYHFPGGSVIAVPAYHPGRRWSRKARADGGALGYVIRTRKGTIYYSGDTDYFDGFKRIGDEFKPDLAILNVNAHLPPDDAARAHADLGYPRVISSHMGAYGSPRAKRAVRFHEEVLRRAGRPGRSAPRRGEHRPRQPADASGAAARSGSHLDPLTRHAVRAKALRAWGPDAATSAR